MYHKAVSLCGILGFRGHAGFSGHAGFGSAWHAGGWGLGGLRNSYGADRGRYDFGRDRYGRGGYYGLYSPWLYGDSNYPYDGSSTGSYYDYDSDPYEPSDEESGTSDYNVGPTLQSGSDAPVPVPDNAAHLTVRVPANAKIWFENRATKQKGTVRKFTTPALDPGRAYTYDVRVRWQQGGHTVEQDRQVAVYAGLRATVDFTHPAAGQPGAAPSARTSGS